MRAHTRVVIVAAACAGALAVTAVTSIALNVSDESASGRTAQAAEILSVTEADSPDEMEAAIGVEPPLQVREVDPTAPPTTFRRSVSEPWKPFVSSDPVPAPEPAPAPAPEQPVAPTPTPDPTPTPKPPTSTPTPGPSTTPIPGEEPGDDEGLPSEQAPAPLPAPPIDDAPSESVTP
ncbi:hypothetical protein [Microbacterium sp. cx-59]|uniref:hypothetical protein n=1 Tax=Microbacterium sp. cx-59 TaxID=2891207 RepID=UPI001E47846B|nr:hypothetical protein [Microbacterium sp. cx-59]MCC4907552.1 hypothetical protein [Microbacterium sp. cx-59]